MSDRQCPHAISSQADIDLAPFSSCQTQLVIQNATGTLNFTDLVEAYDIIVLDSPHLEVLSFPVLESGEVMLSVVQADSLKSLSLPRLKFENHNDSSSYGFIGVNDAPVLMELNIGQQTSIGSIFLSGITPSVDLLSDGWQSLREISEAVRIETDYCVPFENLGSASYISMSAVSCWAGFPALRAVEDILIKNAEHISFGSPLRINHSLTLENCRGLLQDDGYGSRSALVSEETTVESDVHIYSNSDSVLTFNGLTTVGGEILVIGNTNCSLQFSHLTEVGNLTIVDNVDTVFPTFPLLQTVKNLHIRGNIDTSPGSYIFPSLTYASGTIKVEPWNDFDCTKLIPKERDLINTALTCNGTNVTAVNGEASPNTTASSVISKGAWAGIGVGIAVVVIGGIAAVIWIVLYLRHLLNNLQASAATQQTKESEKSHATSKQDLKLDQTQQLDGQGIVREKPDDHLREMHAVAV